MKLFALTLLALVGVAAACDGFTSGSSFAADQAQRIESFFWLISHDGCSCAHGGASATGSSSASSSVGSTASLAMTTPASTRASRASVKSSSTAYWMTSMASSTDYASSTDESTGPWKQGDLCYILEFFKSLTIESTYESAWLAWIKKTQLTIVEDESLTEVEIISELFNSLSVFFVSYPEIETTVNEAFIPAGPGADAGPGGAWSGSYVSQIGPIIASLKSNASNVDVTIEDAITFGSNGSCPLNDALLAWAGADSSKQAAVQVLITKIKTISQTYSVSDSFSVIYSAMQDWFAQYSQYETSVLSTCSISGFGVIRDFFTIAQTYYQSSEFSTVLGGDASSCLLNAALKQLWQNTSYGFTESQRSEMKQLQITFETSINQTSSSNTTARCNTFQVAFYQDMIEAGWDLQSIWNTEIESGYTIFDLLVAYVYQGEYGCPTTPPMPLTTTASSTPSTSTTTTTASTSTTTTTKAPTTTTVAPASCPAVTSCVEFSQNTTLILTSITQDQKTNTAWTNSTINQWKPFGIRLYNIASNTTLSRQEVFTQSKQILSYFASTTSTVYRLIQAVFIQSWGGNISNFCSCSCASNGVCSGSS